MLQVRELTDCPITLAELAGGRKYIYVLKAGPLIKIGISNDVDQRVAGLQVCFPYKIEIVRRWRTPFARQIEKHAHDLLDKYWSNSEWFFVPPRLGTWLVSTLIEARPATRKQKDFDWLGVLFCKSCEDCQPIRSSPSKSKKYRCRSCDSEMEAFELTKENTHGA